MGDYDRSIDVWSVGCIFAEMIKRKPLFPGRSTQNQLQLIIGLLGAPDQRYMSRIPDAKCQKFIQSLSASRGRPLAETVPKAGPAALDIMNRSLLLSRRQKRRRTAPWALILGCAALPRRRAHEGAPR